MMCLKPHELGKNILHSLLKKLNFYGVKVNKSISSTIYILHDFG